MTWDIWLPWALVCALIVYIFAGTLRARKAFEKLDHILGERVPQWPTPHPDESKEGGPLDSLMPQETDESAMMALIAFTDLMRTPAFRHRAKKPVMHLIALAIEMRAHFIECIKPPPGVTVHPGVADVLEREGIRLDDYKRALGQWSGARESDLLQMEWHAKRRPMFKGEFNNVD